MFKQVNTSGEEVFTQVFEHRLNVTPAALMAVGKEERGEKEHSN